MAAHLSSLAFALLLAAGGLSLVSCASAPESNNASVPPEGSGSRSAYAEATTDALIDALVNVGDAAPALSSTANFDGFIALDEPYRFTSGVIGSPPPTVDPVMRELVRRGPAALPALLRHLDDNRQTRLSVGTNFADAMKGGDFPFMAQIFSEEYDAKARPSGEPLCAAGPGTCRETSFDGPYVVRVGDLCFGLIGQIVNRHLDPVRYQPTAILIVNSPVETPALAAKTRNDWQNADAMELRASLLRDVRDGYRWRSALPRLRLYFPDAYDGLSGPDLERRLAFEAEEQQRRSGQATP